MSTQTEDKILARLEKIENLLTTFVLAIPNENDPTENDVLLFTKAGRAEYDEGKTKKLESFGALR